MQNKYKIIIGILIGAVIIFLLIQISKRKNSNNNATNFSNSNNVLATADTAIPQAVQEELKYHYEGESLYYLGTKYTVVGGQWVIN